MQNQILEDLQQVNTEVERTAKSFNNEFYYLGRFVPTISQRINTKIMFVAEMPTPPSKKDKWNPRDNFFISKSDLKFVKLLNKLGLDGCYISDVVKTCAPAGELKQDEIEAFKPILFKEIEIINPKLIVSLGKRAHQALLTLGIPHKRLHHPAYPDYKNYDKGLWIEYENRLRELAALVS